MHDVQRKSLARPVRIDFSQLSTIEQVLNSKSHDLSNTRPGKARAQHGAYIRNEDRAARLDWNDLAPAMELPLERAPGQGVAILDACVF